MGATKIINVLKEDSFEEIFDLFQSTPANDVIFVLPKRSKLFSHQSHFSILAREAEKLGKVISVLSTNPDVNAAAQQQGFTVMSGKKPVATLARTGIHTLPPSDSSIHDDSADAYDKNSRVVTPSDETFAIQHGEEEAEDDIEHQSGMRIVEGDELKEELGGEGEEHYHEKDTEPAEEELKELEDDTNKDDAEFVIASDQPGQRVYRIVTAAKPSMDGVIATPRGPKKSIRVPRTAEKPTQVGVHRGNLPKPEPAFEPPVSKVQTQPIFVPGENTLRPMALPSERSDEITTEEISKPDDLGKERADTLESVWKEEPINQEKGPWTKNLKATGGHFWNRIFRSKKPPVEQGAILPGQMMPSTPAISRSKVSKKLVLGLLLASVVVLGAIVYATAGAAEITIRPVEKKLDTAIKAEASDSYAEVDPVFNKIPGQVFTIEKTVSQEFQATGETQVAQKARGTLTVYNNFSSSPQTLIATTRFVSDGGLTFRTLSTITVPGSRVVKGNAVPGTITVEVIADKPGTEYNVPAGQFKIVAFKEKGDMERYEKFYGQSSVAMKGGASGMSKIVTELDFTTARDTVTEKLKQEIQAALEGETGDLEVANAGSVSITSITSTAEPDTAGETFTVTASGTIKTVGFKKEDVEELVVKFVEKSDLTAIPEKLDITYSDAVFSQENNKLAFNIVVSGPVYAKIDQDAIISDLMGKSEEEIREYLKSAPGVASAKIILSPFWITKMPNDKDKIKFEIAY